ncbi:hypothetical protein yaldo0001_31140 [Yersinia aldovae ATCC 35236]|nr:hypothetical protein yaldo0001_31140 [Yersinia aldovae ATCC 35236]
MRWAGMPIALVRQPERRRWGNISRKRWIPQGCAPFGG